MFGLGLCFMLRHSDTFALSDAVGGHARSVFLGSARAYLPGFHLEADPFQHPLVLARALALPGERRRLVQRLAEVSVQRPMSDSALVEKLRDERAAKPTASAPMPRKRSRPPKVGSELDQGQLVRLLREFRRSRSSSPKAS